MSGELEASGALATAGLAAGAIEGREPGQPGEGACLNCGAKLAGPYCGQCGQHAHPHRKLTHVVEEMIHGLVHFDTKAWRTLPMLIVRPGTLTRNYVYGKRARYISPIAMFLFSIFFMFFVFAFATPALDAGAPLGGSEVTAADLAHAREELAQARADLASAQGEGLSARLAGEAVARAEAHVLRLESLAAEQGAAEQSAQTAGGARSNDDGPNVGVSIAGRPVPENSTWQDELRAAVDRGDVNVNLGHPKLNEKALETLRNPDLALYKIQQAAYKFSFLLAPLSLPFVALLFLWKKGVTLYDHMAYALYALSFAALLFVALALLARVDWLGWTAMTLVGVGLPVHTYFHLKGAYALGWWSALWRAFLMLNFAVAIAALFVTIIVILGLTG